MSLNFNDLPGDIKSMIFRINREAERDEHFKMNYNDFVRTFHDHVDCGLSWLFFHERTVHSRIELLNGPCNNPRIAEEQFWQWRSGVVADDSDDDHF